MKRRYSEYVRYKYSNNDEWFDPQVGWDAPLFIEPQLLKNINIPELKHGYEKVIEYISNILKILDTNIDYKLKRKMVDFEEVKEANLGFSYDSNEGSGLTGEVAIKVMIKMKKLLKQGLFDLDHFENIVIFDDNINSDRITDMILCILKQDFIKYSLKIAYKNNFPTDKFKIRTEFDFNKMKWKKEILEIPYIINDKMEKIPVILVPKSILVQEIYSEGENFIDWLYSNKREYLDENFEYRTKKNLYKLKWKIAEEIANSNRNYLLKEFSEIEVKPYNLEVDEKHLNNIYELAKKLYKKNREYFNKIKVKDYNLELNEIVKILLDDLEKLIENRRGYNTLFSVENKFLSEPKISKLIHTILELRIKNGRFDVQISPETNSGFATVDLKISKGEEKIIIENKVSSNPKLLDCLNEGKQLHKYMELENCKEAYLIVFINKEDDVEKINELHRKADKYNKKYLIHVKYIKCM